VGGEDWLLSLQMFEINIPDLEKVNTRATGRVADEIKENRSMKSTKLTTNTKKWNYHNVRVKLRYRF